MIFSNSNTHHLITECKYAMMALAQNPDFTVKYVYHEEFHNETLEPINGLKTAMLSCIQYET